MTKLFRKRQPSKLALDRQTSLRDKLGSWVSLYYQQARKAGLPAKQALDYARTKDRFDDAEAGGRARIVYEPDEGLSHGDICCEKHDEARCPTMKIADREGVWVALAQVAVSEHATMQDDARSGDWQTVDSLGGIVGQPVESIAYSYDVDLWKACLERLNKLDEAESEREEKEAQDERNAGLVAEARSILFSPGFSREDETLATLRRLFAP